MRISPFYISLCSFTYEKRKKMSFLKKYWWIVAAALIYFFWDKIKPMLGGLTSGTAPAPEPTPISEPTDTVVNTNEN